MEHEWQIKIDAFEGPLDLLLHLIQKNKLDILDIPISLITSQYLEYLELMQAQNMVVAGEYLLMAATLLHIKSKMLLPRPEPGELDEDDPRMLIVRPLRELLQMREAAHVLLERPLLGRDVFLREGGADEDLLTTTNGISSFEMTNVHKSASAWEINITQLFMAFKKVMDGHRLPTPMEVKKAKQSVSQWMERIMKKIKKTRKLSFFELFHGQDREVMAVIFLSILELAKLGNIRIIQEEYGGDIMIKATS